MKFLFFKIRLYEYLKEIVKNISLYSKIYIKKYINVENNY